MYITGSCYPLPLELDVGIHLLKHGPDEASELEVRYLNGRLEAAFVGGGSWQTPLSSGCLQELASCAVVVMAVFKLLP